MIRQRRAYEMLGSLVGSEVCIRDGCSGRAWVLAGRRGANFGHASVRGARLYARKEGVEQRIMEGGIVAIKLQA